jgi:hypothetical protein
VAKKAKLPTDVNARAKAIVDLATSDEPMADPDEGKNARAVAAGREGGKKGGRARAEKLTPQQRSEIAKKAAAARWGHPVRRPSKMDRSRRVDRENR